MAFIKIDKKNYFYNLDKISEKLAKKNLLMVVLKDNAYGHGLEIMAKLSFEYGIKGAIVRDEIEANKIKKLFKNILILSPSFNSKLYKNSFSLAINSLEDLKKVNNGKIELKIDTGMHRNGILPKELPKALEIIKKRNLNFFGFFTHFRSADELSSELFWQQKIWEKAKLDVIKFCKKNSIKTPRFHSKNSAGIFRSSKKIDEFVRAGIAIYGYSEMDKKLFGYTKLKPVLSLWAEKISTRKIKKNQKVGYGGLFKSNKNQKISTYDLGYANGIFRSNPQKTLKIKNNKILGKVSMDYVIINSSKNKICIFDDATYLKKRFETISYEILVKLPSNIKRVIEIKNKSSVSVV